MFSYLIYLLSALTLSQGQPEANSDPLGGPPSPQRILTPSGYPTSPQISHPGAPLGVQVLSPALNIVNAKMPQLSINPSQNSQAPSPILFPSFAQGPHISSPGYTGSNLALPNMGHPTSSGLPLQFYGPQQPMSITPVQLESLNAAAIAAQVDGGQLPAAPVLSAIFQAPETLGKSVPKEFIDLKDHLLDRIINHNRLMMSALETREDVIVREIANKIHKLKGEIPKSDNPFNDVAADGEATPLQEAVESKMAAKKAKKTVKLMKKEEKAEKKSGLFRRMRNWFRRGTTTPRPDGLFDVAGQRHRKPMSLYQPPMKYSAHLVPLSTGALDLNRYEFDQFHPGHPRITRRRFITRVILDRGNEPEDEEEPGYREEVVERESSRNAQFNDGTNVNDGDAASDRDIEQYRNEGAEVS